MSNLDFLNKLLKIYYEEWKTSSVFEDVILKEIYGGANKKRPKILSEIEVHQFTLHGQAPTVSNLE
jgi:Ca2+-dependent lipid-binding protein